MVKKFVLDNGTTVLIDRMQDVRSFALGFFVGTGSGDEPAERQGISPFLEHLPLKRTPPPSAEPVRITGRAALSRPHRSRYTPGNLIISVAGHVRVRECLSEIEKLFRRRASRIAPARSGAKRPTRPRGHQDLLLKLRRGFEQA